MCDDWQITQQTSIVNSVTTIIAAQIFYSYKLKRLHIKITIVADCVILTQSTFTLHCGIGVLCLNLKCNIRPPCVLYARCSCSTKLSVGLKVFGPSVSRRVWLFVSVWEPAGCCCWNRVTWESCSTSDSTSARMTSFMPWKLTEGGSLSHKLNNDRKVKPRPRILVMSLNLCPQFYWKIFFCLWILFFMFVLNVQ